MCVYIYICMHISVTLILVLPLFLPGTTHLTEMINGMRKSEPWARTGGADDSSAVKDGVLLEKIPMCH